MILLESGPQGERAFDAKAIFAAQLAARGHRVAIDDGLLPEDFDRHRKYEVAPYLASVEKADISEVLVIGAEQIEDETLLRLREHALSPDVPVLGVGRFDDHQARIGAETRLAYALGREPKLVDLSVLHTTALPVTAVSPLAVSGAVPAPAARNIPELFVFLPPEVADEPSTVPVLAAMDNMGAFRLNVVAPAKGKELIRASRYSQLCVFSYSEVSPVALAKRADVAVFFGDSVPGERMAIFALELMGAGRAVVDATVPAVFERSGAPALRGPEELAALPPYLEHTVLPNLDAIGRHVHDSAWIATRKIERLESELGLDRTAPGDHAGRDSSRHVFFPTNGNGLGHAQRCTLIAAELKEPEDCFFAAFPSCLPLLQGKGHRCLPMIARSDLHPESFANDLVNYLRLRKCVTGLDHFVFDGGYIFDSVLRTIVETGCKATWIRRGLLKQLHVNSITPERENAFDQVIVPLEAFDELNADNRFRLNTARVGPIVQERPDVSRDDLRQAIKKRFGVEFDTLVVSALGGGVAADRSAQLQSIAMMMENRPDCLHLTLIWPNAVVAPSLYGWSRTRVVTTRSAVALLCAADLAVSAAGYNSFHEMLYHRVPTVLIPQSAEYMDDQEKRARAAADRGLAEIVLADELLKLDRTVAACLDNGRAAELSNALAEAELPPPGNAEAAQLLERAG